MAEGRFIAVVGPSGVGKDSVMAALAEKGGFTLMRRVITRAPEAGGEDYDAVDEAQFENLVQSGAFALHWRAHGLRYGVPTTVEEQLRHGQDMLVNLSRAVLPEAQTRFARFLVLSLTAPEQVLAARLAGRGRESAEEIAARLRRSRFELPGGLPVLSVDNSGPLHDTIEAIQDALQPDRAQRCIS